jgi:putative glutamine amidotransferase
MNKPVIGITADIADEYFRLKRPYCDAIVASGGFPLVIPPAGEPLFYAGKIDGLLIPGGDDLDPSYYHEEAFFPLQIVARERSDFEIALLREIIRQGKPSLGICYGMQLMNVALGGSLYQDIGSQQNVAINHKKDYHTIVVTENRFLKNGTFSVNSTHHQAIKTLAHNLLPIAYSQDNLIEAFCGADQTFLIGVQWHPERLMELELSRHLFESFVQASALIV